MKANSTTKFYVSINRNIIRANIHAAYKKAPIRISEGKHGKPKYRMKYHIPFDSMVIYSPTNPLPCGARVWIEFKEAHC